MIGPLKLSPLNNGPFFKLVGDHFGNVVEGMHVAGGLQIANIIR